MEISLIAGFILSVAIGITLGIMGSGGSIVAVPILIYVLGFEVHQAIDMSLAVVGVASLIAAGLHNQHGTVKLKIGILLSVIGMPGAYLGARLRYLLSPDVLILSFAVLKIVFGIFILIKKHNKQVATIHQSRRKLKILSVGSIIGLLTGFLGVGGGFIVVPALINFYGLSLRDAIGTSLLIVASHCGVGLIDHLYYRSFDLRMTILVTIVAIDGALIGTALSYRVSPAILEKWFVVFVIAVAIFLIVGDYVVLF